MKNVNNICLSEAKSKFSDFKNIVIKFDKIQAVGIHGSLTAEKRENAKDADYIIMLNSVNEPIGADNETNKYAEKVFSEICKNLKCESYKSYVSENLSLIGYSIKTQAQKKLSFHFVSLAFCRENIKSLFIPSQQIGCIFSHEIFPAKIYRLWVKDTIILFDRNGYLEKMKRLHTSGYHSLVVTRIKEHLISSINQYHGCHDKSAQYILKQSVVNSAVLFVYALNQEFFGSPKNILKDFSKFKIGRNKCQIIQSIFENPDSDDLFNGLIDCFV